MHWKAFEAMAKDYDPELMLDFNRKAKRWVLYKPVRQFGRDRMSTVCSILQADMKSKLIKNLRCNDPRRFKRIDGMDWYEHIHRELNEKRDKEYELVKEESAHEQAHDILKIAKGRMQVSKA